jgi:hypothetical protein
MGMGLKGDAMGVYDHSDIKIGDVVIVACQSHALRSGAKWYPFAICVGTAPTFTLVSEEGDMKWSSNLPDMPLRAVGRATPQQMTVANKRYHADREQERQAELKTALASSNIVYRTEWTEYEFGQRPDGVSYAADLDRLKSHIKRIEAMGSSGCYCRASDITQAIVTPEFYAEIVATEGGTFTTARHDHEGMLGTFKARN